MSGRVRTTVPERTLGGVFYHLPRGAVLIGAPWQPVLCFPVAGCWAPVPATSVPASQVCGDCLVAEKNARKDVAS